LYAVLTTRNLIRLDPDLWTRHAERGSGVCPPA
jgi:hypothetical protein